MQVVVGASALCLLSLPCCAVTVGAGAKLNVAAGAIGVTVDNVVVVVVFVVGGGRGVRFVATVTAAALLILRNLLLTVFLL